MKKLVFPLALFALIACEKEIDFEIPDPGKKVVIETKIEAGEAIEMFLSESVYSLSAEDPSSRDDFEAFLYSDEPGSPFQFTVEPFSSWNEPRFVYRLNHNLIAGQNYQIVVRSNDLPEASVNERIPSLVEIDQVQYDSITKEFNITFKDNAATKDYYRITVTELSPGEPTLIYSSIDLGLEFFGFSDFFGEDELDGRQYGAESFLPDVSFNGQNRSVKVRIEQPANVPFVQINLHHISESYYRHELTKNAYQSGGDLFSEPVQIFSNVNNGYGIMATSVKDSARVRF